MRIRAYLLVTLALVACSCGSVVAGTLDDFEKEAAEPATESARSDTSSSFASTLISNCAWGCVQAGVEATFRGLGTVGMASLERLSSPEPAETLQVEPVAFAEEPAETLQLEPVPFEEMPAGWSDEPRIPARPFGEMQEPPRPPGETHSPPAGRIRLGPRALGDLQIPFLSLEVRHQWVEADVGALDGRAEAGYGPLGLAVRYTHYEEESPEDELDIIQWHGLYRMSFTENVEVDLGFGSMTLDGNEENSGFSMTLPMRIGFDVPIAVVFRPTWSWLGDTPINDYDVGLFYSREYFTVGGGYRWLECGDSSLSGPFAGVSFQL